MKISKTKHVTKQGQIKKNPRKHHYVKEIFGFLKDKGYALIRDVEVKVGEHNGFFAELSKGDVVISILRKRK